ncbi:MAG: quinolinate synthase NadA [Bdellovibrionales bacterium]|nr:quinolinate synthase NadA [Bdellovibrionales bacterium]
MLNLFDENTFDSHLPQISEQDCTDQQVLDQIWELKKELQDKVILLGHHYQSDDIIQYADITGDSLKLSQKAAQLNNPYTVFCGVHFMAETADILTRDDQDIILPDRNAGCSMADMANDDEVHKAYDYLTSCTKEKIIPITYINCSAKLKSFVGKHDGTICTSSNAQKIIKWAFEQGQKLLFFPDQHLGRNTCYDLGIKLDEMVVYNPHQVNGGLTPEQIQKAKVILWYGFCSVHQGFTKEHIINIKKESPDTIVIVHPECSFDVVQHADDSGSTAYIIDQVEKAAPGTQFAVGTEINLVNRLAQKYTNKTIKSLSPYQCLCTTMYRVRPRWLLASLNAIKEGRAFNIIKVAEEDKHYARMALNRMLEI